MKRLFIAIIGLSICFTATATSAWSGFSRLMSTRAVAAQSLSQANDAISYAAADPQSHFAKGLVLRSMDEPGLASASFERAVELSPSDHRLWLELGSARQAAGDNVGAVAAFTKAVMFAPYYGKPHWELGNALLSIDRKQEAFVELRFAMQSDPLLAAYVINLIWTACDGDATQVLQAIQPNDAESQLLLASLFVDKGSIEHAVNLLRAAGPEAEAERYRLTSRLINSRRFRDAFKVWQLGSQQTNTSLVNDGRFENNLSQRSGFLWQTMRQREDTRISIDRNKGFNDTSSLSIVFNGTADPRADLVRQLVILEPNSHYRLSYETVNEDLSIDEGPVITIVEAGVSRRLLASSQPVTQKTDTWQTRHLEFDTGPETEAAYISITRQKCRSNPCLITGKVWFDNFLLRKI
jgi:tetratricopeptide (TPR) repeat protein